MADPQAAEAAIPLMPVMPVNVWTVSVQDDPATSEAILQLPEALLKAHDWRPGDVLSYEELPHAEAQAEGADSSSVSDADSLGSKVAVRLPSIRLINLSREERKSAKQGQGQGRGMPSPGYPETSENPPSPITEVSHASQVHEASQPGVTIPEDAEMPLFLVDTVVMHRHRYAVRARSQVHALDTVVCGYAEPFSQERIDESIFCSREVTQAEFLQEPEMAQKTAGFNAQAVSDRFIHVVDYKDRPQRISGSSGSSGSSDSSGAHSGGNT